MIRDIWNKAKGAKLFVSIGLLITVLLLEVVLTCLIPTWRQFFYDVLNNRLVAEFSTAIIYFIALMGGLGIAQGIKIWLGQRVAIHLRTAATKLIFKPWAKGKKTAENYTQSMTESLRIMLEGCLELGTEVIISFLIVVILIIQAYSQPLMLSAALVFTVVASLLALWFNKPLIDSNFNWQIEEGKLREAIYAVAHSKDDYSFKDSLQSVVVSYGRYIKILMNYTLFSRMKSSLSSLVPYLILSGAYFSGDITLGQFMNGVATFELIVVNSTILLVLYPRVMQVKAAYKLVLEFYEEVKNDEPIL